MVYDAELIERLRDIVRTSDRNTATIRRHLEEEFGIDLSDRKAFIREQVDEFMLTQLDNAVENEEGIDGEGEAEVVEEEEEEGEEEEQEEGKEK